MPRLTEIELKKFIKFLEYIGCHLKRQKGDHLIYDREGLKRPIVIQNKKTIPKSIILNNLRTLNINREEYLKILDII